MKTVFFYDFRDVIALTFFAVCIFAALLYGVLSGLQTLREKTRRFWHRATHPGEGAP